MLALDEEIALVSRIHLTCAVIVLALTGCCSAGEYVSSPRYVATPTPPPATEPSPRANAAALTDPRGRFTVHQAFGDASTYYLTPSSLRVLSTPTGNPIALSIEDRASLGVVFLLGSPIDVFHDAQRELAASAPGARLTPLPVYDAEIGLVSPLADGVEAHLIEVTRSGHGWLAAIWLRADDSDAREALESTLRSDAGVSLEIRYRARVVVNGAVEVMTESVSCNVGGVDLAPERLPD